MKGFFSLQILIIMVLTKGCLIQEGFFTLAQISKKKVANHDLHYILKKKICDLALFLEI